MKFVNTLRVKEVTSDHERIMTRIRFNRRHFSSDSQETTLIFSIKIRPLGDLFIAPIVIYIRMYITYLAAYGSLMSVCSEIGDVHAYVYGDRCVE